jgi:hypothetical protein
MPYKVVKKSGSKPYKIIKTTTGKIVGSSTSKKNAKASVRARYWAEGKKK